MTKRRHLSPADRLIINFDQGLRTLFGRPLTTGRPNPAEGAADGPMEERERALSAGLMRVNHAGEVAAQGLYQGQALTARSTRVRDGMRRAAEEENDHLAWCEQRLEQLGSHTSRLAPLWYLGAFAIGATAGAAGDRWSLGFVADTEHQVMAHLEGHMARLPAADAKSRLIIEQMHEDEGRHATVALEAGGAPLPAPVKRLMTLTAKVMTNAAYWV